MHETIEELSGYLGDLTKKKDVAEQQVGEYRRLLTVIANTSMDLEYYAEGQTPAEAMQAIAKMALLHAEPPENSAKVAEQPVGELVGAFDKALDHLRTRECEHSGDYASCQREIEATLESHRTHDLRNLDGVRPTCPAVNEDKVCQEDLGHPPPHRYCAGKGYPVLEWPIR